MSFEKNATPLLKEAVASIAPKLASEECPVEVASDRQKGRIKLYVARRLFGVEFRGDRELDKFLGKNFDPEADARKCRLSQETLPFYGIGADSFFLNEYFPDEGPRLSGYVTLRDWDEHTHSIQERYAADEGHRADGVKPYEGRLLWDWGRWLDNGRLVYGNLSVASSHMAAYVADYADDLASERYKTTFVEGPENGKRVRGGIRWDMIETPVANGAKRFASSHIARTAIRFWDARYKKILSESGVWVSVTRTEEDGEINDEVVFSGVEAMSRTRFRHWLEDIAALEDGKAVYEGVLTKEKALINNMMEIVFDEMDAAAETLGDLSRGKWRELTNIVFPALLDRFQALEGFEFTPEKTE
jgi:hypothetical protein